MNLDGGSMDFDNSAIHIGGEDMDFDIGVIYFNGETRFRRQSWYIGMTTGCEHM